MIEHIAAISSGLSAQKTRNAPLPGMTSEEVGTPMTHPLAMEAPCEARCFQQRKTNHLGWG
eukprot:1868155-Alexandrium_andersonii.AAC.1